MRKQLNTDILYTSVTAIVTAIFTIKLYIIFGVYLLNIISN
jgi:hypothetical protein